MQTIFCTECGSKNIYSGAKPKFCSSCGSPIGGLTIKPKANKSLANTKRQQVITKDGETDIDYVPQIDSLDYEITNDGALGSKTYNFKDLFNARGQNEFGKRAE